MVKVLEKSCTVSIEKKAEKVILKSSQGLYWEAKLTHPEISIANVLTRTMTAFYKTQEEFSNQFIVTMKIESLDDE